MYQIQYHRVKCHSSAPAFMRPSGVLLRDSKSRDPCGHEGSTPSSGTRLAWTQYAAGAPHPHFGQDQAVSELRSARRQMVRAPLWPLHCPGRWCGPHHHPERKRRAALHHPGRWCGQPDGLRGCGSCGGTGALLGSCLDGGLGAASPPAEEYPGATGRRGEVGAPGLPLDRGSDPTLGGRSTMPHRQHIRTLLPTADAAQRGPSLTLRVVGGGCTRCRANTREAEVLRSRHGRRTHCRANAREAEVLHSRHGRRTHCRANTREAEVLHSRQHGGSDFAG